MDAINTVAKENGYTYVLDISTIIICWPTKDNFIGLVKRN